MIENSGRLAFKTPSSRYRRTPGGTVPLRVPHKQELGVQSWVQLEGLFQLKMVRKLRQINESLIGYEPEGREFLSRGSSARVVPNRKLH
jgi:hypothetical protein